MHLGSIYLIVNDFEKSIDFYERLLEMPVSARNMNRFAQFVFEGKNISIMNYSKLPCTIESSNFEGKNISIMNGHFDAENPEKVVHKGEYSDLFDDLRSKALAQNTHKFVLNFWDEDLRKEYDRVKSLNITQNLSKIKYINNVSPYYFFHLTDPDENIIEVTGNYTPKDGEFDE